MSNNDSKSYVGPTEATSYPDAVFFTKSVSREEFEEMYPPDRPKSNRPTC